MAAPIETFATGRDFAAWLGFMTLQKSTGGKQRLGAMLARKPRMLVTAALANKMARIVWVLLAKGGVYRSPVAVA